MNHHVGNVTMGPLPPYQLAKNLLPNATDLSRVSGNVLFAGRIVHRASDSTWKLGMDDQVLPYLLMANSDDLDVGANDGGDPTTDADAWQKIQPTGEMPAVAITQGNEYSTTEFKTARTYLPNEPLKAPLTAGVSAATDLADAGVLTNQSVEVYTNPVVGLVSEPRNTSTAVDRMILRPRLFFLGFPVFADTRA
jgi:hypothetical protein